MNLTWYQDWYFVCMSASPWGHVNLQEANTAKKSYNQAGWGLHFEAFTGEDPRHEGLRGSLLEPGQTGGARAQYFKISIAKPFVHNFVPVNSGKCQFTLEAAQIRSPFCNSFVSPSLSPSLSLNLSLSLYLSRLLPPWMRRGREPVLRAFQPS